MPGFLLNVASTVICAHGGQAKPTVPNPRVLVGGLPVKVMGMPVLMQDSQVVCIPTGTPLTVILTQTRVKGM